MSKIESFIREAMKYKGDKYSQPKRLQPGYSDCSSLIQKALNNMGCNTNPSLTVTTHRMGIEGDARFRNIPLKSVQRGDLLWGGEYKNGKWDGHVAIYLGDGKTLEARYQEGVCIYVNRPYFTRAYRIVALEESTQRPVSQAPQASAAPPQPPKYVPIVVCGKNVKSGIVLQGTTYITVKGQNISVRDFFETLGMTVTWKDNRVYVE